MVAAPAPAIARAPASVAGPRPAPAFFAASLRRARYAATFARVAHRSEQ